jgi:ATP-binding cassette subfamily C protein
MALLQVVGIASILPFMQLVAEPETIVNNQKLQWIYNYFAFTTEQSMLIATGVLVFVLITVGNIFSAFTVWLQHKYAWEIAHNVSTRLLFNYLTMPYDFFIRNNVSDLLNKTVVEVVRFTKEVLIPLIELIARGLIALVIFVLLLYVDPQLAIVVFGVLGLAYLIIYGFSRRLLTRLGEERTVANEQLLKTLNEVLSGFKTVRVYGAESLFYHRYKTVSSRLVKIHPLVNLISVTPRYLIELLAFGGILGITLTLLITAGDVKSLLPILTLYVLAGYRLLPALQKAFTAAASLRHSLPTVDKIYADLHTDKEPENFDHQDSPIEPLSHKLSLENLSFKYDNVPNIEQINLEINKGSTVAFVGSTGSGKTTLVNLIVGLLQPQSGNILIDQVPLDPSNTRAWNRQIGYVPQDVFLFEDTIARNIAIGIKDKDIDPKQLESAARLANIHDFIVNELPDGYQNNIGDRGVRLSGGQKQRVGLARAFYRRPGLIILDEATNALDSITENSVIEALNNVKGDITVIIIAHRISSVKNADCIYLLEKGKIKAKGHYEMLIDTNDTFREMARHL